MKSWQKTAATLRTSGVSNRKDWVSKTDLIQYLRCPYAFWQIDCGRITWDEVVDQFTEHLFEEGRIFEETVRADAVPLPQDIELEELLKGDQLIYGLPPFRNPKLMIVGAPDGIQTSSGALIPVEMKSHKDVQRSDELELAFYWLLLEPYRTRSLPEPVGQLILRRNEHAERVEFILTPERFNEVRSLIAEIRVTRRKGVKPRVCSCLVCSGPLRKTILRTTRKHRDLTMIFGIGRNYGESLEALGIANYDSLLTCNPELVVNSLKAKKNFISVEQIAQWRAHARSYINNKLVFFGTNPNIGPSYFALDLEYDVFNPFVWLVGLMFVEGDRREYQAFWADSAKQEKANLLQLVRICTERPYLPIVTWSGLSADIPNLREAMRRHRLSRYLNTIAERHVDLFQVTCRSLRLPTPTLSLKEVCSYLGVPRTSKVADGTEALGMFYQYQGTKDAARKARLKKKLTDYNRDDVESIVEVKRAIEELSRGSDVSVQQHTAPEQLPKMAPLGLRNPIAPSDAI